MAIGRARTVAQTDRGADIVQAPASKAELTGDIFVRGVALALRAQWEGEDHFGVARASLSADPGSPDELPDEWAEYRAESEAAILAYLDLLHSRGFRIVRSLS